MSAAPARLSKNFRNAAMGVLLVGAAVWLRPYLKMSDVPLSKDEKKLTETFFGADINTDIIRKNFAPRFFILGPPAEAQVLPADTVNVTFFGLRNHSFNYATADARRFGMFIHEMTHLWQTQQHRDCLSPACHTYEYTLSDTSNFMRFGFEQQAAIVEDYACRFIHPDHRQPIYCQNPPGAARDSLLKKVVEARLPVRSP